MLMAVKDCLILPATAGTDPQESFVASAEQRQLSEWSSRKLQLTEYSSASAIVGAVRYQWQQGRSTVAGFKFSLLLPPRFHQMREKLAIFDDHMLSDHVIGKKLKQFTDAKASDSVPAPIPDCR
jgi:hypothetical protein